MTHQILDGQTIAVWFSCGAASAVAAKLAVDLYGARCNVRIINNPVAEEDADNRRFLADVEKWIGRKIEIARNPDFPSNSAVEVWEKRDYMAGIGGAPCTMLLKKRARQDWETVNHHDHLVMGFTTEERDRAARFALTERANLLPILIEANMGKQDCFDLIQSAGIELPLMYRLGYPNANCIGCVKATSPTYWNHVRAQHPAVFEARANQSRRIGARLVRYRDERIFLDELPADALGKPLKGMDFECGIFCEEKFPLKTP